MAVFSGLAVTQSSSAQAASAPRAGVTTKVSYQGGPQQWVQLTRTTAGGRRPTVIFLHGGGWVGGGVAAWASEASYWSSRGWVSLNASYRLGTTTWKSGQDMLADVSSVLHYARSLPFVDRSRIIVVGDSAGGHLAAYMAARHHGAVAGMILWSPIAAPIVAEQTGALWDGTPDCPTVCNQQRGLANRASTLFGYSATATNPLTYLEHYGAIPTWVAGSKDEWVPFDANGGALCAASRNMCSQHLVDGDLHATKLRDADRSLLVSARRWAARTVGVKAF